MPKPISWRRLVQRLRQLGFIGPAWGGRHPFMVKGTLTLHIPRDHGKDISDPLLREILRQAEIELKEWNQQR